LPKYKFKLQKRRLLSQQSYSSYTKKNFPTSFANHDNARSRQHQNGFHKLLIVDLYPTIAIGVEIGERLCDLLYNNASAHEPVERDPGRSSLVTSDRWRGPLLNFLVSVKSAQEKSDVANRICVAAEFGGEGRGYSQIGAMHPAAHDDRWCQICRGRNGGTRLAIPVVDFLVKKTTFSPRKNKLKAQMARSTHPDVLP
jgi:hypothetical protein